MVSSQQNKASVNIVNRLALNPLISASSAHTEDLQAPLLCTLLHLVFLLGSSTVLGMGNLRKINNKVGLQNYKQFFEIYRNENVKQ